VVVASVGKHKAERKTAWQYFGRLGLPKKQMGQWAGIGRLFRADTQALVAKRKARGGIFGPIELPPRPHRHPPRGARAGPCGIRCPRFLKAVFPGKPRGFSLLLLLFANIKSCHLL
jgi:hypothetical protein